jgi:hypothetical protein
MSDGPVLPDGRYDAFVIDATVEGDTARLELTVIAGPHKGEVVAVVATGLGRDEIDLVGVPATVTVDGGAPVVAIEG